MALLLIEGGTRVAGSLILGLREKVNVNKALRRGACRVMCIGESTTMFQYPSFLEKELNKRAGKEEFVVIDCGVGATNTSRIANSFNANLDKYEPQIVVAMMGINDRGVMGQDVNRSFAERLRLCRLFSLLKAHIMSRMVKGIDYPGMLGKSGIGNDGGKGGRGRIYVEYGNLLLKENNFEGAREMFSRALARDPGDVEGYVQLSVMYREKGRFEESEMTILRALKNGSVSDRLVLELGRVLKEKGDYGKAEAVLKKLAELRPGCAEALPDLADIYALKKDYAAAEKQYLDAAAKYPNNSWFIMRMAEFYFQSGDPVKGNAACFRAHGVDLENTWPLLDFNHSGGECEKAERMLLEYLRRHPGSNAVYYKLIDLYTKTGQHNKMKRFAEQNNGGSFPAGALAAERIIIESAYVNYRKVVEMAQARGIKMVCMQYPRRSVEPLRRALSGCDELVFVSNEENFRDALKTNDYTDLFRDNFAGDFGHCTDKGNRLIAENLADVIFSEAAR